MKPYNDYIQKNYIYLKRYNFRLKIAINLAIAEAMKKRSNNRPAVGTNLMILGIMAEGEGLGYRVLSSKGLTLKGIQDEVSKVSEGIGVWDIAGIYGYTYGADRALEFALEEADRLGHNYIGTEHLLLGIINDIQLNLQEDGYKKGAAAVLEKLGIVDFKVLREEILELL
jgi:ATP-dependent Clp protease ATP-binding subunit ClpC